MKRERRVRRREMRPLVMVELVEVVVEGSEYVLGIEEVRWSRISR